MRSFLAPFLLLFPCIAFAALTPAYYTNQSQDCYSPANPCGTANKIITVYIPINTPGCSTSVQGCIVTSAKGLDGRNSPITVDAVRLGKARVATCASDRSNYGKYFNIGVVTYRSDVDKQMHTVQNVVCYVHDTGGAFYGHPEKLDLAVTLCPECTDADARRLASGSGVSARGFGPLDANIFAQTGFDQNPIDSGYYCVTSIDPVVVVPSGTVPTSRCYNQQPAPNPFAQLASRLTAPNLVSPVQPLRQGSNPTNNQVSPTTPPPPAALLIAQPSVVVRGNLVLVSWSSVGMNTQTPCRISAQGQSFAEGNTGSKTFPTNSTSAGQTAFTLSCVTQAGQPFKQTVSVNID